MTTILSAAASGMVHNQSAMDTIAHNVANANSAAFRRFRILSEGAPDPDGGPERARMGVVQTTRDLVLEVAAPQATADPMHFTLTDEAFFAVQDLDGGTVYARYGGLTLDSAGNVLAYGGRKLAPPIQLAEGMTGASIDAAGVVSAVGTDGERVPVGQLTLARFVNPQGLEALGDGFYRRSVNSGAITTGAPGDGQFGTLLVGSVESSNVDLAEEFVAIIVAKRAYQANAKTFSVGDQMLELATDLTQ